VLDIDKPFAENPGEVKMFRCTLPDPVSALIQSSKHQSPAPRLKTELVGKVKKLDPLNDPDPSPHCLVAVEIVTPVFVMVKLFGLLSVNPASKCNNNADGIDGAGGGVVTGGASRQFLILPIDRLIVNSLNPTLNALRYC
jgi:hypothetical protein